MLGVPRSPSCLPSYACKPLVHPCRRAEKLISFGQVTEKNIEQLRKLNLAVFPVRYSNKFYTDIVASAQKKEEFTCLGVAPLRVTLSTPPTI